MDGKQKLEELVAGLDGVTPGPWKASATEPPGDFCIHAAGSPWQMAYTMASREGFPAEANAAHIARCDPNTIRSISDAYKALEAENDRLRKIVSECATALGNGAYVGPECTIEFMGELPREIALHVAALRPAILEEAAAYHDDLAEQHEAFKDISEHHETMGRMHRKDAAAIRGFAHTTGQEGGR